MTDDRTTHDTRQRRCPRLGHEVDFAYCRQPAAELPCRKILDCWWEYFDVDQWLRANYTPEQIERILAPAPDKLMTLVDLIEQAKRARDNPSDGET